MPFSYPDDVVSADNGLTVDGDIQIDSFSNIARFGPQEALSVLVNATDVFSQPEFLASAAIAGYTLQVNATADGLEWAPGSGSGGGEDWAATLALGNNSGANNPHVDTGQFLGFGLEGSTPVTGQIRSSTDFEIRAIGSVELISTTTMQMQTIGSIPFKIVTNAVERLEIQGDGAWQIQGDTGTSGQFLKSAGSTSTPVWNTFALSDLPAIAAKSVLANATNASAVPAALAGSAAFQHLRVNSANTGLEWAVLTVAAPITISGNTIGFDQTATLDNNARVGVRKNTAGSTFLRRRLNLIEGTGITLTVADDAGSEEVDVTVTATGTSLSAIDDQRVLGNDSGSSAVPTAITVHQELDWIGTQDEIWVFDGVDDSISYGNVLGFERTDTRSFSFWFQTSSSGNGYFFTKNNPAASSHGFHCFMVAGQIFFELYNTTGGANDLQVRSTGTYNDGALHHAVVTYAGTSLASGVKIYVDDVLDTNIVTDDNLTTTIINTSAFLIGSNSGGANSFDGLLKQVSMWDFVLSAGNVTTIFTAGPYPDLTALGLPASPIGWWKLDENDSTAASGVLDYGTGSNEGTAAGGLAPSVAKGALPVRNSTLWQYLLPGPANLFLSSNGVNSIPSYKSLTLANFPAMAAGSILANVTAGSAVPTAHDLTTFAGAGLTYTNVTGILAVGSSTSITVNANDIQRAALTGAVTAGANSNTTAFGALAAKSVLANATNASAVPAALAGSAAFQHLRVNSANTTLEWAVLTVTAPITLTSDNIGFDQTATLGNNARVAVNKNSGATVGTRRRLNFIEGTGTTLTITDDAGNEEVDITIASAPAAGTVTPTMLSVFGTPTNTGVPFTIYVAFAAAAAGTPDDVTVFSGTAPFNFRILEAWAVTATAIGSSTIECRTATGGGGSALTTAMSTTVTGKTSDNSTATTTVAASGSVFIRRSDRGVAGELILHCIRT